MRYVIIGNSYAAFGAIEAIRPVDGDGVITVISDEVHHCYARPLITFWLGGSVTTENMYYRDADYYRRHNILPLLGSKAESIDADAREVVLAGGDRIPYDKLLIATGGTPFVPAVNGLSANTRNVHTFTRWDDAMALRKLSRPGRHAVVVGGGLIGLKAAEGLNDAGVSTTIVELGERVLSLALDEISGNIASRRLNDNGITTITGTTVDTVIVNDRDEVTEVLLQDGHRLPCDILVIAIGVRPSVELAKTAGIDIDRGIVTDATMGTSIPGIYAAGDVAQNINLLSGNKEIIAIVPVAYDQGRVAGRNMAGVRSEYKGAISMNSVEIYGLPIMSMGITNSPDGTYAETVSCSDDIYRKYVFDADRLVGALLVGNVDYAGVLTHLISSGRKLSKKMTSHLLAGDLLALAGHVSETPVAEEA